MEYTPLNLAHFHERRADKFVRHHRYEDAQKAIKTSLFYLQNAYKSCAIPKSIEVLDTQKWEYERRLRQIQMRKQQHERAKLREIVPLSEANSVLLRVEAQPTAQSVAKSIDKTVRDFDEKFGSTLIERTDKLTKENQEPREREQYEVDNLQAVKQQFVGGALNDQLLKLPENRGGRAMDVRPNISLDDEIPSLAPLELPSFDFNISSSTLVSIVGLAESLQK